MKKGFFFTAAALLCWSGVTGLVPATPTRLPGRGTSVGVGLEAATAAVAGGSIGVMGSVAAIEAKKQAVQASKMCPYCVGTGSLMCAACMGAGCSLCSGLGSVSCENCKGRGRFMPTMLDARASRDPETLAEDIGLL